MEWINAISSFFENKSVAAFAGGFGAFLLVIVTDWRRERRKVRNICSEVEMNMGLARAKLDTVRSNRSALRDYNQIVPAPILKFNTAIIRSMAADVLSRLTMDQRLALEAVCYMMEATDEILFKAFELAKEFGILSGSAERIRNAKLLLSEFDDAIVNLKRLEEICTNYINGKFSIIVNKQYQRRDYEERQSDCNS
jgi:hypothetical protein